MSELKVGDRVKAEFMATVIEVYGGQVGVQTNGGGYARIGRALVTKLTPPLPTKEGSVIESYGHRFMLTRGGWHAASDSQAAWTNAELQDSMYAEDFTVVLEG